jgi:hypothetical protein
LHILTTRQIEPGVEFTSVLFVQLNTFFARDLKRDCFDFFFDKVNVFIGESMIIRLVSDEIFRLFDGFLVILELSWVEAWKELLVKVV